MLTHDQVTIGYGTIIGVSWKDVCQDYKHGYKKKIIHGVVDFLS